MSTLHTYSPDFILFMDALYEKELDEDITVPFSSISYAEKFRFKIYGYLKALQIEGDEGGRPHILEKVERLKASYQILLRDQQTGLSIPQLETQILKHKLTPEERRTRPGLVIIRSRSAATEENLMLRKLNAQISEQAAREKAAPLPEEAVTIPVQFFDMFNPDKSLRDYQRALLTGAYKPQNAEEEAYLEKLREKNKS